ncbi:UBA/TS-N domain containing protein [Trichomonas vaginalis G3]|uniref:UBA/TS-N domain containing protein n=1 Tax=Trichomonas vaginalis (strain ATCC PRA-98 / G3) TaxID=412133 RepID=A2F378_TRIV3|nr:UV excision repair protein RAD23 family [Trichomonas vaginalis G3]EAY00637.1 UBA/TS-N domain containing protein [Trichomonas vaginalis G3]KAI5500001.1 UV excision repair protein RAD23 family [Trichomonas vaginalis G3]|eukprot:XP_001313566.1 UBA/TS-N domain containing protein [Trichomonas vaginalis G3]
MKNYLLTIDIPQYGRTHRLMVFEDECLQSIQNELATRGINGKYKCFDSNNNVIANDVLFSKFDNVEPSGNLSIIKVKIKFDDPEYEKLTLENFDINNSSTQEFSFQNDTNNFNKNNNNNTKQQLQNQKESEHENDLDDDMFIPLAASQENQIDDNLVYENPQNSLLLHINASKENEENQNKTKENESTEVKSEETNLPAKEEVSSKEDASDLSDLAIEIVPDPPDEFLSNSLIPQELIQQNQQINEVQPSKSENSENVDQKQDNVKSETPTALSSVQVNMPQEKPSLESSDNVNQLSENKNNNMEKLFKQNISNPSQNDSSSSKPENITPYESPKEKIIDEKPDTTKKNLPSPSLKAKLEIPINDTKSVGQKPEIKMPIFEFPKSTENKPLMSTESNIDKHHKSKVKHSDTKNKFMESPKPPMPPPESPKPPRFTPSQSSSNSYKDPPEFSELVSNLTEMGFERKYSENALRRCNYNPERAVNLLMSGNGIVEELQPQIYSPSLSQRASKETEDEVTKVAKETYNNLNPGQKAFVDKMVNFGFTLHRIISIYDACDYDNSLTETLLKSS